MILQYQLKETVDFLYQGRYSPSLTHCCGWEEPLSLLLKTDWEVTEQWAVVDNVTTTSHAYALAKLQFQQKCVMKQQSQRCAAWQPVLTPGLQSCGQPDSERQSQTPPQPLAMLASRY